jgi:transcriptional regulator with XRE-family HTH domain
MGFSTIAKIERGDISPTYDTILRLADGLDVDVEVLFIREGGPKAGRRSIGLARHGVRQPTPNYIYEMLHTDLRHKKFIPIFATITAREPASKQTFVSHEGEEFIFVLKGRINLHTAEYEVKELAQGDSCYFNSLMPHCCTSVSEEDAEVLWICSNADVERQIYSQLNDTALTRALVK